MGKGTRNRQNREEAVEIVSATPAKKKKTRVRKPLSPKVKSILTYAVTILLLLGALAGILSGMGTFKRANVIVKSESGKYNLNQQMATYIVWSSAYYEYYNNWQYYMTSDEKATFNNALNGGQSLTAAQYALYAASNLTQQSLKTAFDSFEASFRGYVAVCDVAEELGISVSKEDLKAAAKEVQEQMESMASSSSMSTKRYIKNAIGNNVKMRDIKKVAKYQALYNKVMENKQTEIEGTVTNDILVNFRDRNDNLGAFYSTDYISYVIKEGEDELKAKLLAATSDKEFKTILAKDTFDKNYKDVFNKYVTQPDASALVTAIKDALKDKTTAEEWTAAIESLKTGETPKLEAADAVQTVTKETENATDMNKWIFSSDRKAFDTDLITTDDAYYVISVQTLDGDNASVLMKKYDKASGESYEEDDNFKANLYHTILVALELAEKDESKTDYSDKDTTTKIGKIKSDLQTGMEKVVPAVTTQAYVAEPKANTYQDWMFDKDSKTAPEDAVAGKVKEFSETTGDGENAKTTVTVYCIVEAMKFETDPVVDGGFITFSTAGSHETDAKNFYEEIKGLTGDALREKFSSNSAATTYDAFYKDDVEQGLNADVAEWLFSADRKADDTTVITVDKNSYVLLFNDGTPTWEYEAESGYVNETLSDWLKDLSADYEIRGMGMVKDKTVTK